MNRELKFRGNDNIGNFIYSDDFDTLAEYFEDCDLHGWVDQEQYTGSKDNMGVEKYQGDIERSGMTGAEYQIYWNDEYSGWYKKCVNVDKKDMPIYYDNSSSRIIGNIHEKQ